MSLMDAVPAPRGRVLVVEDDESAALFVTRVLSRSGLYTAWVTDAEQAGPRLAGEAFDVLLADYRLPGRSGIDLARDTRRAQPGIGIAVMTSFAEGDAEHHARASGADDFFEKPLHSSNLVSRIRDLVTRSREPRPATASSRSVSARRGLPAGSDRYLGRRRASSVPQRLAESGPERRAVQRGAASAVPDTTEFTGDAGRARSSATRHHGGAHDSGCEGMNAAIPRGEIGRLDRDLLARASRPALEGVEEPAGRGVIVPVLMWASEVPATTVTSRVGRVTTIRTLPGWSRS
jgi:DNA-binding response OmpR family regulator